MTQEALELVNRLLNPKRLSYIQEIVFIQSLSGKIYRDIAAESGYDLDYIKEVGAQLWNALSEVLGERVTKKNIRWILENFSEQGYAPVPPPIDTLLGSPEIPSHAVPLYSRFYVDRPPIETQTCHEITRPGSLIRIRAPLQMGKTSLLLRILDHAKQLNYRTVAINFHRIDQKLFGDVDRFLRWFCVYVSHELGIEPRLVDYWDEEIGYKISCSAYFQRYLLPQVEVPLVLGLDEVDRIFEHPELAQEFLPLLRSWHEAAAEQAAWQHLRMVIVHSTEAYVPLKLSQSPFNVGLPIQLPPFTLAQVEDLAQRYGLDGQGITSSDWAALIELVGGHPYLIRLALHVVQQDKLPFATLMQEAATQSGIYNRHLRHYWVVLQQYPELVHALWRVVNAIEPVSLEAIATYRLESMGLIKLSRNAAVPGCELYRSYFQSQFDSSGLNAGFAG